MKLALPSKYAEATMRILDLLGVYFKSDDSDQKIIGIEIEKCIEVLTELDRTGISPRLEEHFMRVVDLYERFLSSSPGERLIYKEELEREIGKVLEIMQKEEFE